MLADIAGLTGWASYVGIEANDYGPDPSLKSPVRTGWAGGALGIFLSRQGKRSFVPAVIIIMTGWGRYIREEGTHARCSQRLWTYSLRNVGT
jgi:hypothetical protein